MKSISHAPSRQGSGKTSSSMAAVSGEHSETAGETTDYLEIKATGLELTLVGH